MEPVKGLGSLLELLRRRLETTDKIKGTSAKGPKVTYRSQSSEQLLKSTLTSRLRQISRDDPERTEKASTIIVSVALADRFGEEALNDPEFIQMIEAIKEVFITEPTVREKVEHFLDTL